MTVYEMKRADKYKHSIWPYSVATLSSIIIGSVLTIFMYFHCKKRSARISLVLTKTVAKQ